MSGEGNTWTANVDSGDPVIDGLLLTNKWTGSSISYYFPATNADYQTGYYTRPGDDDGLSAPQDSFQAIYTSQVAAIHFALSDVYGPDASDGFSVAGFTNMDVIYNADGGNANLRFGNSNDPSSSYSFGPGSNDEAGDIWLGDAYDGTPQTLKTPVAGNNAWFTVLRETGHALGLEFAHVGVSVPSNYDSIEYTVMSFRSYRGASLDEQTFEEWGAPQTFMMYDIAALQHMYGADYTTNADDTVYKWDPGSGNTFINGSIGIEAGDNRIFATIWDGGGIDTYDLSAYSTGMSISLLPGGHSFFDFWNTAQRAYLGDGKYAEGTVYNALLHDGNLGSLIENAIGGSEGDSFLGNQANNALFGGAGRDGMHGYDGNDWLSAGADGAYMLGGQGADWFILTSAAQQNFIQDYDQTQGDIVYIGGTIDMLGWTLSGDNLFIESTTIVNWGDTDIRLIVDASGSLEGQGYTPLMGGLMQNGVSGIAAAIASNYSDIFVDADDSSTWFARGFTYNSSDQLVADVVVFDDKSFQITNFDVNPASGTDKTISKYSALFGITSEDIYFTNGVRLQTIYDATSAQPYIEVQNTYNPAGGHAKSYVIFDDLTSKTTFFDPADTEAWTYIFHDRNAASQLTRREQVNDDGTKIITTYDPNNAQSYASVTITYNVSGQVTKGDFIYDDGTRKTTISDLADAHSYSTVVQSFNPLGENVKTDAIFDDGTRTITTYDPIDLYNYKYAINNYDSSGNLAAVNLYMDIGTRKETLFDTTNSELYSVKVSDFNASNQLVKLVTFNDDSTRFETSFDRGSASWLFSTKVFDAASQLDTIYSKNDDGTAVFIDYDQDNSYSWALRYVTFDALGAILTDDYIV